MKNMLRLLVVALGVWGAVPVGATTWGYAFNSVDMTVQGGSIYCGSNPDSCQAGNSAGLSGSIMKMTAYSTPTEIKNADGTPNVNALPPDVGSWVAARMRIYGDSGLGISNNVEPNSSETSASEHAMDNNGVNDILVVDFNPLNLANQNSWDVTSFELGYLCNALNDACSGATVDVQAWIGSSFPNTAAGFSGNEGAATLPGFTALSFTNNGASTATVRNETTTAVGRYLVITGDLSRNKDAFKLKGITANKVPPPPPPDGNQVPLPGSVPLVGLALLALAWVSRSRRLRPIPIRIRR